MLPQLTPGCVHLQIEFKDLEMHRIIGTGQFGLVRVVRHIGTNQVYALKVRMAGCEPYVLCSGMIQAFRSQRMPLGMYGVHLHSKSTLVTPSA